MICFLPKIPYNILETSFSFWRPPYKKITMWILEQASKIDVCTVSLLPVEVRCDRLLSPRPCRRNTSESIAIYSIHCRFFHQYESRFIPKDKLKRAFGPQTLGCFLFEEKEATCKGDLVNYEARLSSVQNKQEFSCSITRDFNLIPLSRSNVQFKL